MPAKVISDMYIYEINTQNVNVAHGIFSLLKNMLYLFVQLVKLLMMKNLIKSRLIEYIVTHKISTGTSTYLQGSIFYIHNYIPLPLSKLIFFPLFLLKRNDICRGTILQITQLCLLCALTRLYFSSPGALFLYQIYPFLLQLK